MIVENWSPRMRCVIHLFDIIRALYRTLCSSIFQRCSSNLQRTRGQKMVAKWRHRSRCAIRSPCCLLHTPATCVMERTMSQWFVCAVYSLYSLCFGLAIFWIWKWKRDEMIWNVIKAEAYSEWWTSWISGLGFVRYLENVLDIWCKHIMWTGASLEG